MDLKEITQKVVEISREAGAFIKEQSRTFKISDIEKKGLNDYVSFVDKTTEKLLVEKLTSLVPGAGFIVEENTVEYKGEKYKWIVDPLDGTTNFIHGFFPYAVSIALMCEDKIILGVIYEIGLDECFYAYENGGAFLNGSRIQVSEKKIFSEALLATGFPYDDFERLDKYVDFLSYLSRNTQGIRRLGSAAVDIAYVSCGRFDAFYEYALQAWDVAAGVIILKEAGGKVCDFKGGDNYLFGKEIVVSNPWIFEELFEKLSEFMS